VGSDVEWLAPDSAVAGEGDDHLDLGPAREPPGWLARLPVPRLGVRALVPLALIATLTFGPGGPHDHVQEPVRFHPVACGRVILDAHTGLPVHYRGLLAELPRVTCHRGRAY
jgi:hypothetical protein